MFRRFQASSLAWSLYGVATIIAIWFLTSAPVPIPLFGTHSSRFAYVLLSIPLAIWIVDSLYDCYPSAFSVSLQQLYRYRFLIVVAPIALAVLLEFLGTTLSDSLAWVQLGWPIRHALRCGLSLIAVTLWTFLIPRDFESLHLRPKLANLKIHFLAALLLAFVLTKLAADQQLQEQRDACRSIDQNLYPVRALRHLQCLYEIDDVSEMDGVSAKQRIIDLMDRVIAIRQRSDREERLPANSSKEELIVKLALDNMTVSQDWIHHQPIGDQEDFLLGGLLLVHAQAWEGLLHWTNRAQSKSSGYSVDMIERLSYWHCLSLAKLGRIDQAIEGYESAIRSSKTPSIQLVIELAILYSEKGNIRKAMDLLDANGLANPSGPASSLIRRIKTNSCMLSHRSQ